MTKIKSNLFNAEQVQFILENYKGKYNFELVELLKEKFGITVTTKTIKNFKTRNGLKSGVSKGLKGKKPWNAGLKKGDPRLKKLEKNWFPKGFQSHYECDVGAESVKEGVVIIKQADGSWKRKSHIVWEQHHGRPVPKGCKIIQVDGNKQNFDIDNLILVDSAVLMRMNRQNRFNADADITKCGVLISQIEQEIYKKKKEKK